MSRRDMYGAERRRRENEGVESKMSEQEYTARVRVEDSRAGGSRKAQAVELETYMSEQQDRGRKYEMM